jgi:methyl-accepting chemotaxis protein
VIDMTATSKWLVALAALAALPMARAQPGAPPTLEERVTALERQVARLDTRFERESAVRPATADNNATLAARINQLERSLERLAADMQRVQRQADDASRAASQAARDAQSAQQLAREVSMRVH